MALNCYLPGNMILIDASGWGDLLLGVVVGAIHPPQRMPLERHIPTSSFQPPNFSAKKYLENANKIADEIVAVMQPNSETCFKVSAEYVLSGVIGHLEKKGFKVEKTESTGELKGLVEDAYVRWCVESGVPREELGEKRRFGIFIDWVAQNPRVREGLVKTGWASWAGKWKAEVYRKHTAESHAPATTRLFES